MEDQRDRFGLVNTTVAGTFRVDEVVAEGGFGIVYRAFHLHFRAPIALKCLKIPAELSAEDRARFLEQFRSEAEILFRLSSSLPQIVRPLHVDAVRAPRGQFMPFMALEWLQGKSFDRLIEERSFSDQPAFELGEILELLTPVAHALSQAHELRGESETLAIVHRDIKPDNLFLCKVGGESMVKILDFGISKVRRTASQLAGLFNHTDGQAPFSPAYGSPEQWVPKRYGPTGPWTDVWGLALTLVELLKGDAVIVGEHSAMMGTALDPSIRPTPRNEGVDVADEVEAVFQKALSVNPRYRYQSIHDFWSALQAAHHLGVTSSHSKLRIPPPPPSSGRLPSSGKLPPMAAPTPWTPPRALEVTLDEELPPSASLPPMIAPIPADDESPDAPSWGASYPNNPQSGLSPVLPAPGSWEPLDLEIPPLHLEEEPFSAQPRSSGARALPPLPPAAERPPVETEIELASTSVFPGPSEEEPPALSLLPPQPLGSLKRRQGTG